MNILEVYKKYQIMLPQQDHQLAVAAVGSLICEHINIKVHKHDVVSALLLHDMGNIIKYKLDETLNYFPGLKDTWDLNYWQGVQQDYFNRYGHDEHEATVKIAKELGVPPRVVELADAVGFEQGQHNAAGEDYERKICAYSDMRVKPTGVVPLEERIADLHWRYNGTHTFEPDSPVTKFDNSLRRIEKQLFEHCDISPSDITQEVVGKRKESLKNFEI